jgi:hypothetical protein
MLAEALCPVPWVPSCFPLCRSSFRLNRELEKYGAAAKCIASREHIAYVVEGTAMQTAEVTELLLDAAVNQK